MYMISSMRPLEKAGLCWPVDSTTGRHVLAASLFLFFAFHTYIHTYRFLPPALPLSWTLPEVYLTHSDPEGWQMHGMVGDPADPMSTSRHQEWNQHVGTQMQGLAVDDTWLTWRASHTSTAHIMYVTYMKDGVRVFATPRRGNSFDALQPGQRTPNNHYAPSCHRIWSGVAL